MMIKQLSPKQEQLLRDYVKAKRQFVEAEAFKKDNRDAVLEILAQVGDMHEIDGGLLWASESVAISKGVARRYKCVKFEDKKAPASYAKQFLDQPSGDAMGIW